MARNWKNGQDLHGMCIADCIPVRGAKRSAIYDLTRHEILTFPTSLFNWLMEFQQLSVGALLKRAEDQSCLENVTAFLDFLDEHEMILLVNDKSKFPAITEVWEYPGFIQNAVIDVATQYPNFDKLLSELSTLGCQHVQIRCFSHLLSLQDWRTISRMALDKSIMGIEIIAKFDACVQDDEYLTLIRECPIIGSLTLHSSPTTRSVQVDEVIPEQRFGYPSRLVVFSELAIESEKHCGKINPQYLTLPMVKTFFEAKTFNGCLNKKVSVDATGEIRNCPSMKKSYGNVGEVSLSDALQDALFKKPWSIAKDQIEICKDCEYRYACSDCRAYLENPADELSKPLKCGYDPYSGVWSDWTDSARKVLVARSYGFVHLC